MDWNGRLYGFMFKSYIWMYITTAHVEFVCVVISLG